VINESKIKYMNINRNITNLEQDMIMNRHIFARVQNFRYSKTCLKRNLKGSEHFSAKARFPFNQGTHIKINPGHARI
jgi:hypothetical protein